MAARQRRSRRTLRWLSVLGPLLGLALAGGESHAFSLFMDLGGATVAETVASAGRLVPSGGGGPPVPVGVEVGFAMDLGATGDEVALVRQAVRDAFAAWESPALAFDVHFDAAGAAEGTTAGFEIDVFAVPGTHPVFAGTAFFGRAVVATEFQSARPLSNGQLADGLVVSGADVFINQDNVNGLAIQLGFSDQERLDALTRLVAHEVGHVLGLGHPNGDNPFGAETNFDTDGDPFNAMVIDGADPFSDLVISNARDDGAVMSNRPCGEPFTGPCPALFRTALSADDTGGRDVLYPVPAPDARLGALAALASLLGARAVRVRPAASLLPRDPRS